MARVKAERKPYPANGFVDADGKLTAAAHAAIGKFLAEYPVPVKALAARCRSKGGKKTGGILKWLLAMVRGGLTTMDDINAEILLSVSAGVRRFGPAKGDDVVGYLVWWVFNAAQKIGDRVAREGRVRVVASINPVRGTADGGFAEETLADRRPAANPDGRPYGAWQADVDALPENMRAVVERKLAGGLSNREVGSAMGFTKSRADAIFQLARARLRGRAAVPTTEG